MLKKIAITFLLVLFVLSGIVLLYDVFTPEQTTLTSDTIPLETLEDYTLSSGNNTTHYYFICDVEDPNCNYVYYSLLPSVKEQSSTISPYDIIDYVNIASYLSNPSTLKEELKKYNLTTYPAFVTIKVTDNKMVISSTLTYDPTSPFDTNDIVNWLKENDVY